MYKVFLLCLSTISFTCLSEVPIIPSSTLNCTTPTEINSSVIVELDGPLEVTGLCELITAGPGFGIGDTVTFRVAAPDGRIDIISDIQVSNIGIIVVPNPGIWDVRSFTEPTQRFIFEDVLITMDPGGSILADGVTFSLQGTSKIVTKAVSVPT